MDPGELTPPKPREDALVFLVIAGPIFGVTLLIIAIVVYLGAGR